MAAAQPELEAEIRLPPKLKPLFDIKRGGVDYRGSHGGRGSAKSFSFALMAAVFGYVDPLRILVVREYHTSIKESFHAELKAAILTVPWLAHHYDIGVDYLRGANGTEFIFRGLHNNLGNIRSLSKIDLTIAEEAEDITDDAWLALEPTVLRQPGSEIWVIWNPCLDGSATDQRFIKNCPPDARIVEMNHDDNPYFPAPLEKLRQREQERLDPATYAHIWEGQYLENSDSQVLHGKVRVAEFTAKKEWQGPYHGADWGFAHDPTAAVRCWIHDESLYVDYEAGRVGLELDHTAKYLQDGIPGIELHVIRSDSARPETISYLKRHGLPNCTAVKKWPGSVEDGITHLRSYKEIVIHPRCRQTIKETRLYSYKVDRNTGDIMPIIVDAHNHYMDALRYAVSPLIKHKTINSTGARIAGL